MDSLQIAANAPCPILDVDYAVLYVYRYGGYGSAVSYDLYLGDSVICRVSNNFKKEIHLKKDGMNSLWAQTESKKEIPINMKYGHQYYLRCGIETGVFVGRPTFELVDYQTGKAEYDAFNAKN